MTEQDPTNTQDLKKALNRNQDSLFLIQDWTHGLLPSIFASAIAGLYMSIGMGLAGLGGGFLTMMWIKDLETAGQRWRSSLIISFVLIIILVPRILSPPVFFNSGQMIGQSIAFGIVGFLTFLVSVAIVAFIKRMEAKK